MLSFLLTVPVLPPVSVTGPLKAVFIQAPLALKHLVLLTVWISQVKKFCFVLFCYFLNDLNKKKIEETINAWSLKQSLCKLPSHLKFNKIRNRVNIT